MADLNPLVFQHQIIDPCPTGTKNDICLIGDINGDGRNDVVILGKYGEDNVVWYENPTWQRHIIGTSHVEAGGALVDITGNGRLDLVAGNPLDAPPGYTSNELYWFECPDDPWQRWNPHIITSRFRKYHDQAVGDVDGDGEDEVLFASQKAKIVAYFDVPADPAVSPWPEDHCHVIADDLEVEGLCIVDLDDDGQNEIVAGPNVFKRLADGKWQRSVLLDDFDVRSCVAVGDLDGDGLSDIVLTEGERDRARVVWLKAPNWEPHWLGDDFYHPHSLALADFDGNGRLDIFVAEMGLRGYPKPREVIFRNLGSGELKMEVVAHLPTHGAKVADMTGNGRPDIVGKPYDSGRDQVDLLINCS